MTRINQVMRAGLAASTALVALSASGTALAQSAAAENVNSSDIIVTANRRNERIQDVPIAIAAVTSDSLERSGVTTTTDLDQVVAGLVFQASPGGYQPHLRGVGQTGVAAGNENSIATYIDGVYILSKVGALLELNSIDQIEVLKGPQGTLFGRNATGGVINVRTRDPEAEFGGNINVGYANYDTFTAKAYVTGGVADTLAVDLAGYVSLQGKGWGDNIVNGQETYKSDSYAVRTKWLFTPSDRDEFRFSADYTRLKGDPITRRLIGAANYGPGDTIAALRPDLVRYFDPTCMGLGVCPGAVVGDPYVYPDDIGPYDVASVFPNETDNEGWGASLQWDHEFDSFRIQTISAYRELVSFQRWPVIPTPGLTNDIQFDQKDDQFSQEIQFASLSDSRIQWLVGAYYLNAHSGYRSFDLTGTALFPLGLLSFRSITSAESGAIFGQTTVPLGNRTNITGGLRYTIEKRGIKGENTIGFVPGIIPGDPPPFVDPSSVTDASETFKKLTWRLSLDHKFTPDVMAYASWNRGFISGAYNTVPAGGPGATAVEPEVLDSYEIGLKGDFFDRAVRLNLAAFYYKYKNLQVTVFEATTALLDNGAEAEILGLEGDITIQPDDQLTITAGFNWIDSEFKDYPGAEFVVPATAAEGGGNNRCINTRDPSVAIPALQCATDLADNGFNGAAGNPLPWAPDFTANVGINYMIPLDSGEVNLNANYSYTTAFPVLADDITKVPGRGIANASINWKSGDDSGFTASVWMKNIFDKVYYSYVQAANNPGGYTQGLRGAPRTFGVNVGYEF